MQDNELLYLASEILEDQNPAGTDFTILNNYYIKSYKKEIEDPETGEIKEIWTKDYMVLVYRNNITGTKHHKIICEPKYMYYLANPDKKWPHVFNENDNTPYPEYFTDKESVHPVVTKYKNLEKDIFDKLGLKDEFKFLKANGDWKGIRDIHKDPRVFMSDVAIEDHYRYLFSRKFKNTVFTLHKSYFDIEVDAKYMNGDFPELGECPINCISYYDDKYNKVFTFILNEPKNPLIKEFRDSISPKLFQEFREFIIDTVGGLKNAKRYNLTTLDFQLYFFDKEIDLVASFFNLVHEIKPDFCEGYNMGTFDMAYIIQRIMVLGYDPTEIMCDKSYPQEAKMVYHFVDQKNKNQLNKRTDFTMISGDVVWIDQLLQFAQKRSAKYGSFDSFKLDDIGNMVAGVKKLDYHHITNKIEELPYLNFKIFVIYNIMDTVVQHCIENKSKDLEYIFNKCLINNTTYAKGHRQTVYLINRFISEYEKKGFVVGNNMNRDNEKPDKYAGALVADPILVNDYSKLVINGQPCMIFDNTIDLDYKALYPSDAMQGNMAPNTQIGLIEIKDKSWEDENRLQDENYWRAGEFIDNLTSNNIIIFANRWLSLANFTEFLDDLEEYLKANNLEIANFERIFNYRQDNKVFPFEYNDNRCEDPWENVDDKLVNPWVDMEHPMKESYSKLINKIKENQ